MEKGGRRGPVSPGTATAGRPGGRYACQTRWSCLCRDTGGAGYIGSHVEAAGDADRPVVVLDNESTGHGQSVHVTEELIGAEIPYVHGEVGDAELVLRVVEEHQFGRRFILRQRVVTESVRYPEIYFSKMRRKRLRFSRCCARAG